MKFRTFLSVSVIAVIAFAFSSCSLLNRGGDANTAVSTATGWAYNDPTNGGFEVVSYVEQETGPGLVLIEGGAFQMGRVEQDVLYDWNNIQMKVTIPTFYMDQTEIKNVDYLEYLNWIRRVFVEYPQVYRQALPDTLVWRRRLAYNEPYVENYLRHPAYLYYPVVGVSWLQATDYSAWRTDRVNEQILVEKGILEHNPADQVGDNNFNTEAYLAGQYEGLVRQNLPSIDPNAGDRPVKWEDGILLPKYQLPTEAEWEYAALALMENSKTSPERVWEYKIYPWNGHYLRNDGKNIGQFNANFKRGRGDMMGVAGALNDHGAITVRVDSYWPNDFGLYCMAGNVNEWVRDVYRAMNSIDNEDFRPYRGNVFQVKEVDKDNNFVEKDSLGRMKYRDMTDEESKDRHNYQAAYNVNSADGDMQSSVVEDWLAENQSGSERMYKAEGKGGRVKSSLITDHVRVYKGGGWRDRAYWMSPGSRRFLDEKESTDDIGFRCSMIRVGETPGY